MKQVLVDTSVWTRRGEPELAEPLSRALQDDRVVMTTPIALELLRSAQDVFSARADADRLDLLRWIPMSQPIERRARDVLLTLARRGHHRGPSPVDLLAAAAAESVNAELWHCDRHFELIGEVTGQPMWRVGQ